MFELDPGEWEALRSQIVTSKGGRGGREILATNKELAKRFAALETRIEKRLANQDQVIVEILQAIRRLMNPPAGAPKRKTGFV
jgi:hypothetical protein